MRQLLSASVIAAACGLALLGCESATSQKQLLETTSSPAITADNATVGDEPFAPTTAAAENATIDGAETSQAGLDWPIFLGPEGTGVSQETGLLEEWPATGPVVLWEQRIGKGYSSPSVRGPRLVVHHRQRNSDVIDCLRTDNGSSLWKFEYDTDFSDPYGYNNGPRCSPLLTENRCYTFGAQGQLVCLDLKTGKVVWRRDTATDWTVPDHFFGAGCTPILEGGLLIVLVGGQPNSGVVALDPETGKTKWESVGKDTWDGVKTDGPGNALYKWSGDESLVSYSSPIAVTVHGQRHLLCLLRQGLVSLDPTTGRVRFKYWFRSRTHESVNAARPVVVDDLVLLSAAYETGAALLKLHADGAGFDEVWRKKRGMSTHWSTPIHHDGCAFGFSGRHENEAMLQCIDLKTGDLAWQTNGYDGQVEELEQDPSTGQIKHAKTGKVIPWPFYGRGSATYAEGQYFVLGERGTLALTKLDRTGWKEISRASFEKLKYPMWASPVLSHGRLYLRSEDWLMCLNVAKPAQ